MLAAEYGWRKADILGDTYLDEVLQLQEKIRQRKLANYRMLLIIQHHGKPDELLDEWTNELKQYEDLPGERLDTAGMEKLKNMMAKGNRFNIK